MDNLKFEFIHPVKGFIRILNRLNPEKNKSIPVDIPANQCLMLPYAELPLGKCQVRVEWEFEGRDYAYKRNLNIEQGKNTRVISVVNL